MKQPTIFSATLGLSDPWHITSINFCTDERRVDINVDFIHGSTFTCPTCGAVGKTCSVQDETWHHEDFFRYEACLNARVPRIECTACGVLPVARPWTNSGSRFTMAEE
jgi:transposase